MSASRTGDREILDPTPTRESLLLPTPTNCYTTDHGWNLFVDSIGLVAAAGCFCDGLSELLVHCRDPSNEEGSACPKLCGRWGTLSRTGVLAVVVKVS